MNDDIHKKEHIKETLKSTSNLKYKAIILFISCNGATRNGIIHLTIKDFINPTKVFQANYIYIYISLYI